MNIYTKRVNLIKKFSLVFIPYLFTKTYHTFHQGCGVALNFTDFDSDFNKIDFFANIVIMNNKNIGKFHNTKIEEIMIINL